MQRPQPETVTLDDIVITEELSRRNPRPANLLSENQALHTLARQLVNQPETMLQNLVDMALDLCTARSAAVSLLETTPSGEEVFHWIVLAGTLKQYVGNTAPRNFSPCGTCLDRGTPQLYSYPGRYFTYLQEAEAQIVETLVLPLIADNHALGTIWIVSHDEQQHFDSEDVRVMTSLADFTATALLLNQRQTRELLAANAALEVEIVERKQAEERSRALIENLPGGAAFVVDHDLRYLLAEGEALSAAGFKPEDLVGQTIFEVLPPELVANYEGLYRTALAGESFEYEHNAHDRGYISRGTPLRSPNGEVYAALAVSYDITDRKRREANLAFLGEVGDDFARFSSPNDIMQTVGEKMTRYFGLARLMFSDVDEAADEVTAIYENREPHLISSALEPQRLSAFVSEDYMHEFKAGRVIAINDVFTDPRTAASAEAYKSFGVGAQLHAPFVREGRWSFIITMQKGEAYNWRADQIELLQQLAAQIYLQLERARTEAALRETEQRLSVIFAQAAVGLSQISLDGHFQQVNDALCRLLGRSREALLAASVSEVTHPDDVPTSLEALGQLIETGEPISLDKRYLHPDGTILWANSILTRLDDQQGHPRHVLVVTIDLSDRKQAETERLQRIQEQAAREEERQRAETLAELDHAKTVFFSNVSHEFRTPLTLLLAPLQDALSDSVNPLAPSHRERLELAHRNSLRLLKLVNTLLDFSRIEAGRMEAVYEATDLALLTTELASVFRSAIERAGLRLIVDCPPLPEPVYVDQQMWEKIVLNLLSNAFKFTLSGEIAVRLHPVDDHHVTLQVQDTGTGIRPEELPHLFERFYQIRGVKARTHEGSGIGLALVHELIRLHGGTVDVSSTLGQGTCFTVIIPKGTDHLPSDHIQAARTLVSTALGAALYVEEAERWLPQESRAQEKLLEKRSSWSGGGEELMDVNSFTSPASPARILLVDDNADMRDYLKRILREHVQLEVVADGASALAAAQERVPDLVLSDVMMPGLDGFELLKALRADARTREIPIIVLSARAGVESVVEGLQAGADDYLIKPFSAQELVSRVNAHLQIAHLRGESLRQEKTTSRRKDEMLSIVSHELNTPLVAILGWTRLLRANPPSQSMLMKSLETIERNATQQAKLICDLLDISRITAGKLHLNLQPVELQSVIEMAIATVRQTQQTKDIELTCLLDHLPTIVQGDPDRLQQIVLNLLTNAIKFTSKGGRIEVRLHGRQTHIQIVVSDTGCGIAAEFLPHVFESFRQAESSKSQSIKGLGLGLAIARHLVELHGGTIIAESLGIGQGATFTVTLPLIAVSF